MGCVQRSKLVAEKDNFREPSLLFSLNYSKIRIQLKDRYMGNGNNCIWVFDGDGPIQSLFSDEFR